MYFYIEFADGRKPVVVECPHKADVVEAYPSAAEINYIPYPLALCINPQQCKGKTSCPRSHSCSE
jgi:hypothetical protein